MQNPINMKETWSWIWKTVQEVYAFLLKPFASFMIVIVVIIAAWRISDEKYQNGYNSGVKNQKLADSLNTSYLKEDRNYFKAKVDSMKNVDCAEENKKAVAYVESMRNVFGKENKSTANEIKEVAKKNKKINKEISSLESLIPKHKKQ